MITFSVGFATEYVRQSMTFEWAIEEGDMFVFDVLVKGNTTTGTQSLPPELLSMNNTRIAVEIISLPNVTITFYSDDFIDNIVEQQKTSTTFVNGTSIPSEYYYAINSHLSWCMLPIGGWTHLDAFFPNDLHRPFMEHESYLSARFRNYFYFGYSLNETYLQSKWYGIFDLNTGIPQIVSFWEYRTSQPWTHWHNVTMSLVT
jgi:hypothetical protein